MKINLIGISGRMGSGKDTVAKILQYLAHNQSYQITSISITDFLNGEEWYYEAGVVGDIDYKITDRCGWEIKKFAGKLKQMASMLTGIPLSKFEDQEFKKSSLPREWDTVVSKVGKRQDGLFGMTGIEIKEMTVRELLQLLGTNAVREHVHPNAWVNALFANYVEGKTKWLIPDTRFINEATTIKKKGGIIIRVNRPMEFHPDYVPHSSEISLDNWAFDYTLDNNGSIEMLFQSVKTMITDLKLEL